MVFSLQGPLQKGLKNLLKMVNIQLPLKVLKNISKFLVIMILTTNLANLHLKSNAAIIVQNIHSEMLVKVCGKNRLKILKPALIMNVLIESDWAVSLSSTVNTTQIMKINIELIDCFKKVTTESFCQKLRIQLKTSPMLMTN